MLLCWGEMLHQDERHPRVGGHMGQESLECSEAPRGGPDADYQMQRLVRSLPQLLGARWGRPLPPFRAGFTVGHCVAIPIRSN